MRKITVLRDGWRFGKSRDAALEPVSLPHTWNDVDGQDGGNDYYRGAPAGMRGNCPCRKPPEMLCSWS